MKKKNNKEKKPNSNISKFFTCAPKSLAIDVEDNENANGIDNSKAFYINALKKKLQSFAAEDDAGEKETEIVERNDSAISVVMEKDQLPQSASGAESAIGCMECKKWETKYKDLKKLYVQLTIHHSEVDMKYNQLLKTKTRTNEPKINDAVALTDDVFSPNQIKFLESIPLKKKNDSTFILKCLEYAYKNDLSVLHTKTLKGKPEVVEFSEEGVFESIAGKDPLTPKKVDQIKELFIERISKCQLDSVSYRERIGDSNVNRLFASGVRNITKRKL